MILDNKGMLSNLSSEFLQYINNIQMFRICVMGPYRLTILYDMPRITLVGQNQSIFGPKYFKKLITNNVECTAYGVNVVIK